MRHGIAAAIALGALLLFIGVAAPAFFEAQNLRELVVNHVAELLVALGMTFVILAGEIDISVGSQFGVCTVAAGWLARAGVPMLLVVPGCVAIGMAMGALNGALVGRLKLPSIIVTLAMLVVWRDALQWFTEGAWVQGLPADFQWLGLGQFAAESLIIGVAILLVGAFAWGLRYLAAGRAVYAVGSNAEAARLAGIDPSLVIVSVFSITGGLVGLAAVLNAVRFSAVPSNAGVGLELEVIAAVVVGGTAITGGSGTILGTVVGVALLGTISTALAFLGINPLWDKAVQGVIILAAVGSSRLLVHPRRLVGAHAH